MRVVLFGLLWGVYACTGELGIVSSSSTVAKDTCDATEGSCEEIGECSNCDENAGCIYNKGSFKCQCNAGYVGDGKTCTDINECSHQLCNGKCINTDGSYECQCNTGYILAADRHSCIIDSCIPNACKTQKPRCMTDEQDPKRHRCFCPNGKVGDKCQHLGPCETAEKRCGNGTCIQVDDVGKYRCDCFKGYVGFYCEFKDHCIAKPCKHGGKCQSDQETGGFICDCHHTGYVGPTCNHIGAVENYINISLGLKFQTTQTY
ncbi:microneme [Paramuricea clavata]|uniref:Microneme n=1 Tax=Paramuricea clavata TaxID=317549 RepID=A0A6S7JWK9_PARCT|nr:microneme [Paramuricea clavata]